MVKKINTEEFNNLTSEYVVLDLFADWCGPCKMLGPVFEEVSEEFENVEFVKVNVDSDGDVARSFGVQSIPTLIILKNKEEISRKIGFAPKNQLVDWIKENTK